MTWHLRITTVFTIPFDLKHFSFTQLLARTAQTHRLVPPAAQGDLGEGVTLGLRATTLGLTTGLRLAAARAERVVRGAVDGPTVRDWLAAVNDGVPTNAVVMRPAIGFEVPKDAGSSLILIVTQDPGCARVMVVASNCCGSFVKHKCPVGQAAPRRSASFGPA